MPFLPEASAFTSSQAARQGTIASLLREAEAELRPSSATPRLDAAVLLCHVLEVERSHLFAHREAAVGTADEQTYRDLLKQRAAGRPVAYLTGRQEFWSLLFQVSAHTLIPRADTELLVEQALARLPAENPRRVLDLGTGSGAVAISIAHERAAAEITATEACPDALSVAAANAARLTPGRVQFRLGDWFGAVSGCRFDIIVSNPPYIGTFEAELETRELRHEPRRALVSGEDGLADLTAIVREAPDHLERRGWLFLEHGYRQGSRVRGLMRKAGFDEIGTVKDLAGHERVTLGRR